MIPTAKLMYCHSLLKRMNSHMAIDMMAGAGNRGMV